MPTVRNTTLRPERQRGFTLVELIMVIALMAVVGGGSVYLVVQLVQGYMQTVQRVELTDTADHALRRMARDIQTALPLSLRVKVSGARTHIEFLPVKAGGRLQYKAACFSSAGCGSLTALGPVNDGSWVFEPGVDRLALWNQDYGVALNCAAGDFSAWCAGTPGVQDLLPRITAMDAAGTEQGLSFAVTRFSAIADVAGSAFRVVGGPVTYVCDSGAGTLTRVWGYSLPQPVQWADTPPAGSRQALLAQKVTACNIGYDAQPSAQLGLLGRGLISVGLQLSGPTESVYLVHQMHVNNAP
jgi:MSHA biogenesis protein MshO